MLLQYQKLAPVAVQKVELPGIGFFMAKSCDASTVAITVEQFQLDDMAVDTVVPVVLSAKPLSDTHRVRLAYKPFLKISKTYQVFF